LGLEVVIEDYISVRGGRRAVMLLVRVGMGAAALASLWAMVRILG
jgi:succinate dehydrogenase hydrophobic anchor subunit